MTTQVDKLIEAANDYVSQGKWELAFQELARAHNLDPGHAGILTGMGRCVLEIKGAKEALPYFQQAIVCAPDSADAHNNLGLIQTLLREFEAAEGSYQMAVTLDPDHVQAWKNLASLYLLQDNRVGEGVEILAAVIQAHPDDADAWFMLGQCYEENDDLQSAREVYRRVLEIQPDHPQAQEAMQLLETRAPAVPTPVDVSRIARPEHIQKLASLKSLKSLAGQTARAGGATAPRSADEAFQERQLSPAFYGPPDLLTETRLSVPARALAKMGYPVKVGLRLDAADLADDISAPNIFIFANPHFKAELCEAVEQCLAAGKRVVIDLDRDYHNLPPKTPGYDIAGPGNPKALKTLENLLAKAELLTVPSATLAERYRPYAKRVETIPYSWTRLDILWDKPAPRRETINLGVVSLHTQAQDVSLIKNSLERLLGEYPQCLLIIGGDMALYDAFAGIPEKRKTFMPAGMVRDYPYLLANFDILLVPLEDNSFNQSISDLPLLEAGIRRIPWVATPQGALRDWEVGGLFAENKGDWYTALSKLLKEANLRQELGQAGREKAEQRESEIVVKQWLAALGG